MTVLLLKSTIQISPIVVVCQKYQTFCKLYARPIVCEGKVHCQCISDQLKLHIVIPSAAKARLSV